MDSAELYTWFIQNFDAVINEFFYLFFGVVVLLAVVPMIGEILRSRQMSALARELHCQYTPSDGGWFVSRPRRELHRIEGQWRGQNIFVYDIRQQGRAPWKNRIRLFGMSIRVIKDHDPVYRQTYINGKYYDGSMFGYISTAVIKRILAGDRSILELKQPLISYASSNTSLGKTIE